MTDVKSEPRISGGWHTCLARLRRIGNMRTQTLQTVTERGIRVQFMAKAPPRGGALPAG